MSEATDENKRTERRTTEAAFSSEETTSILKGFVTAYLRGKVSIVFPDAEEVQAREKRDGNNITLAQAAEMCRDTYRELEHFIGVFQGTIPSTKEERAEVIQDLISMITRYRSTHRLKGEFDTFDSEQRLQEITEKLDAIGTAFEAFVKWLQGI